MISNSHRTFTASPWRRIFCSLFLAATVVALIAAIASSRAVGQRVEVRSSGHQGAAVSSPPSAASKIAPWVMQNTANGQQAQFFVVLADQADLSSAADLPTKIEKGRFVYQTLLEKAHSTQEPILQWLGEHNIEHQSFYIVNAILVKGDRQLAETLAARPDVAHINGNPLIHNDLPQPSAVEQSGGRPATIEPGIVYTHAPDVWSLGF